MYNYQVVGITGKNSNSKVGASKITFNYTHKNVTKHEPILPCMFTHTVGHLSTDRGGTACSRTADELTAWWYGGRTAACRHQHHSTVHTGASRVL